MRSALLQKMVYGVAAAVLLTGCYNLTVPDTSGLTREDLFSDPTAVETHVATVFVNFYAGATNALPWNAISAQSEEITTSSDVTLMWDLAQEPRAQFNNADGESTTGGPHQVYPPWHRFFEGISYTVDMLKEIRERKLKITDRFTGLDNTTRTVSFAKWVHGMSTLYIGMVWDQAPIVPEKTDLTQGPPILPLHPHKEVFDSGVAWVKEAISIVDTARTFTLPRFQQLWIYGQQVSSGDWDRYMRSWLGRSLVYEARNPTERAAVDWAQVKTLIGPGSGIVADFGPGGWGAGQHSVSWHNLGYFAITGTDTAGTTSGSSADHENTNVTRTDLRLLGPGDTTGAYQAWLLKVDKPGRDTVLPVILGSPDHRIQIGGTTGNPGPGTIFRFTKLVPPNTTTNGMLSQRGKYYYSNYYSLARVGPNGCNNTGTGSGACMWAIQIPNITVDEMNLLTAEADFRQGDKQGAADLINISRVRDGALPPVTVTGPPQATAADKASCVPKKANLDAGGLTVCGDLWDSLMYEDRIQLFAREGIIQWGNMRGWGCLLTGSMVEYPVPANDLELSGFPVYTLGGVGQTGGAPKPDASCLTSSSNYTP